MEIALKIPHFEYYTRSSDPYLNKSPLSKANFEVSVVTRGWLVGIFSALSRNVRLPRKAQKSVEVVKASDVRNMVTHLIILLFT